MHRPLIFHRTRKVDEAVVSSVPALPKASASSKTTWRSRYLCRPYLGSIGVELGGAETEACCTGGVGGGSVMPLMPSLKPRKPSPSPLPNSGSRLAPNSRNATTANTIRCHGCNRSPIVLSSARRAGPPRILTDHCRTKLDDCARIRGQGSAKCSPNSYFCQKNVLPSLCGRFAGVTHWPDS
jgi:hypothetical protein